MQWIKIHNIHILYLQKSGQWDQSWTKPDMGLPAVSQFQHSSRSEYFPAHPSPVLSDDLCSLNRHCEK